LGFEDETWFSRFERPSMHSWADAGKPARLLEKVARKDDPEPKALSCYGLYVPELRETWLRFVDGRPVSSITPGGSFAGAATGSDRGVKRPCFLSGTTQAGTKAERSEAGSPPTTVVSKPAAVGFG